MIKNGFICAVNLVARLLCQSNVILNSMTGEAS